MTEDKMSKRISVCMATYNGEKYISKQLESILSQIGSNDEVIISDDCSTDKTLKIVSGFQDSRVKIVVNHAERGPVKNFEHSLLSANGDFILLADQDDIWLPNKVNVLRFLLQSHDLILSDCIVVDSQDNVLLQSFFQHRKSKIGFWSNLYRNSYVGCCMAFRKEVLSYALPFPPCIHMHDWWIGLLVEAKGEVHFCAQPLIRYVRHGENASPTGETGYSLRKKLMNRYNLLHAIVKRLYS